MNFMTFCPYLGGSGEGEGMPAQAIWVQGDYVKISHEIDQKGHYFRGPLADGLLAIGQF